MNISSIINLLPQPIRKKFEGREGLLKIVTNINWLTFERIVQMGISLFVAAWVARYLGPNKYGAMNYAIAFVALFTALSKLGLDAIVVRNIVQNPQKKEEYLGTTLWLKFLGSLALFILASLTINFLNTDNPKIKIFVIIIAFGYIFKSFETIDLWFQSQVKSKYTVFSRSSSFLISSILKIILILTQSPLIAFIWIIAADSVLQAIFLILFYQVKAPVPVFNWKIKLNTMKALLKDSWPLILSGIAVMIYMKIDQVMIGSMIDSSALGVYSAAVRISEKWYFIPTIISASVFPSIIKSQKKNQKLYLNRVQKLYDFFTWFSISIALLMMLSSGYIINILYGKEYAQGASVLSVHIWAGVFVFLGVASSKYLIAENLTKISFFRTILGAISNVILNIILIPLYGIIGAAYATLISYGISAYLSNLLFKKSRIIFGMFLKSLFPINYLKAIYK
jgi:polysaccharide transporter, PST family